MTKKNSFAPHEKTASSVSAVGMPEIKGQAAESRSAALRDIFPEYRDRVEVEREIASDPELKARFLGWEEYQRKEFLDICSGNKGVRILHDAYFKYVFNPDQRKEELSRLISILIRQEVKDIRILPNESHLGGDYALVIMDIIVETADGSIVNVEVQKIGYSFPGERASCYNADLLLRQYQRVRRNVSEEAARKGENPDKKFSYRMIRPVYTIIFMEKSNMEFKNFMNDYIHTFVPTSDTGLKLNLLQNIIYIPLDVFENNLTKKIHDNSALTEKEAWLAFLSSDDPKVIYMILEQYPGIFRPLYEKICDMCRNTAEVMSMYSKELAILDKNTVMLMMEEQQATIEKQQDTIDKLKDTVEEQKATIEELKKAVKALQYAAKNAEA